MIRSFYLIVILCTCVVMNLHAQKKKIGNLGSDDLLTDYIDTSKKGSKNRVTFYTPMGQLSFSGYIQPQFQFSESEGAGGNIFQGGEFSPLSNNRFRLRRGRLRTDFTSFDAQGNTSVYFVFQFDGSEQGVNIRDFWGRYYENKWKLFHVTAGMMARPFGHEILLSSVSREAPERGRMSQILMKTERDLGITLTFNPRSEQSNWQWLSADLGVYNGQGLSGPMEFDNHKELIARVSSKKVSIKGTPFKVSGGISGYLGGLVNQSPYRYTMVSTSDGWRFQSDSLVSNVGKLAPRKYYGADLQFVLPNRQGQTEFRFEYIAGVQSASRLSSITPPEYPIDQGEMLPLYTRNFNGAYIYFLQHLGTWRHQFVLKYDWYDPNTKVQGADITPLSGLTQADIRFNTFGAGYVYYFNRNLKTVIWFEHPINEQTELPGWEKDLPDGVLTLRAQFSF